MAKIFFTGFNNNQKEIFVFLNGINNIYTANRYKLSFQADLKDRVFIKQRFDGDVYESKGASIVEFDKKCENDKKALEQTANYWSTIPEKNNNFAIDIYNEFLDAQKTDVDAYDRQFFGITLQDDKFENMNSDKLLGLAQVCHVSQDEYLSLKSDGYMLDLLQTKPNNKHGVSGREYKEAGQRMLEFVIKKYTSKPLLVVPTKSAEQFYYNNGFRWMPNSGTMIYVGNDEAENKCN